MASVYFGAQAATIIKNARRAALVSLTRRVSLHGTGMTPIGWNGRTSRGFTQDAIFTQLAISTCFGGATSSVGSA